MTETIGSTPDPASTVRSIEATLRRRLIVAYAVLMVAIVAIGIGSVATGIGFAASLSIIEIVILTFTLLILVLLSVFTSDSFSRDVREITTTFDRESRALLDRSQHHWEEQTGSLTRATEALQAVVQLERDALSATQETLRISAALLDIERRREELTAEEAQVRIQRIRPSIALSGVIIHPTLIAKHIGIRVFNQGEDARRMIVSVRFGTGPDDVSTRAFPSVAAFSNKEADFGDIDVWADDLDLNVGITTEDVDGNRYQCNANFQYSRNRGILGSDPRFAPDDWQYPQMSRG